MYKLSKTNIFFSHFEGTRREKNQIFRTLVYAGYKMAGTNSTDGATATLASPDFLVEEHPLECFHFWFNFGVSII